MKTIDDIFQNRKYKTESPMEELVVKEIIKYNIPFQTQYKVGPFFLDIAFPQFLLALEIDGFAYHSSDIQRSKDELRTEYLENMKWHIERVPGWFCYRAPSLAALKIVRLIPGIEQSELFQHEKTKMITYHMRELVNEGEKEKSEKIFHNLLENN